MAASERAPAAARIDEIAARASAEAARRRAPASAAPRSAWATLRSRERLDRTELLNSLAPLRLQPDFAVSADHRYRLADFTQYHGAAFVNACYSGLLRRATDAQGLDHNLRLLAAGRHKAEIAGRIRYSAEGRRFGARVSGLAFPFALALAGRIPLLGYLLQLVLGVLMLPRTLRRLRQFETYSVEQTERLAVHQAAQLRRVAESLPDPTDREAP